MRSKFEWARILVLTVCLEISFLGAASALPKTSTMVVKVGIIQDLSGKFAVRGANILKAVRLAQDKINESADVRVELIVEDDGGKPEQAVLSFRKLTSSGVRIVVGSTSEESTNALMPVAADLKTLLVSIPASMSGLRLAESSGYGLAVSMNGNQDALVLQQLLAQRRPQRVSIVYSHQDGVPGIGSSIRRILAEQKIEVIDDVEVESLFGDRLDEFYQSASIHRVGLIVALTAGNPIDLLLTGMAEAKLKIPVFVDAEGLSLYRNSKQRSFFQDVCFAYPLVRFWREQPFFKELKDKFNLHPSGYLDSAFDALFLVVEAVREAKKRNISLKDAATKIRFTGVVGEYSYSKSSSLSLGEADLVCIEKGDLVLRANRNKER